MDNNLILIHSECGSNLFIQASIPTMIMTTSLSLIGNVINVTPVEIVGASFKLKVNSDTLYCQHCRRKVKLEEIESRCNICKKNDNLDKLYIAVPRIDEQTATNLIHEGDCHKSLVDMYIKYFRREIKIDLEKIKLSFGGE